MKQVAKYLCSVFCCLGVYAVTKIYIVPHTINDTQACVAMFCAGVAFCLVTMKAEKDGAK